MVLQAGAMGKQANCPATERMDFSSQPPEKWKKTLFYRGGKMVDVVGVDLRSTSTAKEKKVAEEVSRGWLPQVHALVVKKV